MMRSVSFVDRLELEYSGNHFSGALTLGDVDSDGLNELVIGNVDGVLAVFKGDRSSKPWRKCSQLGTITSVAVGDLYNKGKNALVAINAKGTCHVFIQDSDNYHATSSPTMPQRVAVRGIMKPTHSQDLHAHNVKVLLIDSIAPGGYHELFVGRTDRGVDVYQWSEEQGSLQLKQRLSLSGQIGSMSVTMATGGSPQLLVSQPGGTYVPLCYTTEERSPHPAAKRKVKASTTSLLQLPMVGQPQRRNPTGSTEMVGQIASHSDHQVPTSVDGDRATESASVAMETESWKPRSNVVALCTLDGSIRMLRNETKLWELQVDHSLFAIEKLDVTGNGEDEIVVCAWDGMTYIVDQARNVVRFQFEENVSAFCAGHYGMLDGSNRPCLIYTTFSNRIYVYHHISLPSIPASNLLLEMASKELPEDLKQRLESLNSAEKQELFHKCLYGHRHSQTQCVVNGGMTHE